MHGDYTYKLVSDSYIFMRRYSPFPTRILKILSLHICLIWETSTLAILDFKFTLIISTSGFLFGVSAKSHVTERLFSGNATRRPYP